MFIVHIFNFQKSYFFSFNCTTHLTKTLANKNTAPKNETCQNPVFFIISAILHGFCYFFRFICIFSCFWKWLMGFPDQKNSWLVPLMNKFMRVFAWTQWSLDGVPHVIPPWVGSKVIWGHVVSLVQNGQYTKWFSWGGLQKNLYVDVPAVLWLLLYCRNLPPINIPILNKKHHLILLKLGAF